MLRVLRFASGLGEFTVPSVVGIHSKIPCCVNNKSYSTWKFKSSNDSKESLLESSFGQFLFDQRRAYWGKEGRVGWRRRRERERVQREALLNPSSPVIDYRYPLPKDDFETLPKDLFGEKLKELSPEEIRDQQNAVVTSINDQINSKSEGRLFAVVHIQGKQFKVTPEDIIIVQDKFMPTIGDQIRLNKVLLVGGKDFTLVGRPLMDDGLVRVEATVIEKTLSYTKLHFAWVHMEKYKRLKFFKTPYTMLRINLVQLMQPLETIQLETESYSQSSV